MKHLLVAALFVASIASPAVADGAIEAITDGQPWTASLANGRSLEMTFNPDGSGRVKFGFLSRSITWSVRGEELCLAGMPGSNGPQCAAVAAEAGGYLLALGKGRSVRLSR